MFKKYTIVILLVPFILHGYYFAYKYRSAAKQAVELATEQQQLIEKYQGGWERCMEVATQQQEFIEQQLVY